MLLVIQRRPGVEKERMEKKHVTLRNVVLVDAAFGDARDVHIRVG